MNFALRRLSAAVARPIQRQVFTSKPTTQFNTFALRSPTVSVPHNVHWFSTTQDNNTTTFAEEEQVDDVEDDVAVAMDDDQAVETIVPVVESLQARADFERPPKLKNAVKRAGHIITSLNQGNALQFKEQLRRDDFKAGDAIQVTYRHSRSMDKPTVVRGIVIAKRNRHTGSSFKMLAVIDGFTVEMLFPLYNPMIQDVKVLKASYVDKYRRTKNTRAKLYYMRDFPQRKLLVTLENTGHGNSKAKVQSKRKSKKGAKRLGKNKNKK